METHHHEWILTNKFGAYALGTGNLINQRKYHGLLIASDEHFQRHHLVAGIEEKVEWRGNTVHLDSNNYSNCIYPEGFLYLVKPWLRPYPCFLYSALPHQNDILILKEIMLDGASNTVLVRYTNLGHHTLHFALHPKFTMTEHHELNQPGSLDNQQFDASCENTDSGSSFYVLRSSNGLRVYGHLSNGEATPDRYTYYNVFYPWEVMSGYPGIADQLSLFELAFTLKVGESSTLLFSDQPIEDPAKTMARIIRRYAKLPKPKDLPLKPDANDTLLGAIEYEDNYLFKYPQYLKLLEFALEDFISNDDVVAGYPFYGVWGRDTMIVLNALLHNPDKIKTVEKILLKYSRSLKGGLIPNLRRESGREENYDTIDATLWYVILLWKLGKWKEEGAFWKRALRISEEVLDGIFNNYQYPFFVRGDGLIELKEEFAHATWMDVRVDGKAVTPRNGAPVEINALWYNALSCYLSMAEDYSHLTKKPYKTLKGASELKDKVKDSFGKFWAGDYLADRLLGDQQVKEIRPNALVALSLPWEMMDKEKMEKVWQRACDELYTPYGIRTLSPNDHRFRRKYYGTQRERDLSFHNGSVWAWLLGPFCGLYLKINRDRMDDAALAERLGEFIGTFRNSFMRGHIASVAEVWDGDNPHFPKGAPALAISVAALYNIETYIASITE